MADEFPHLGEYLGWKKCSEEQIGPQSSIDPQKLDESAIEKLIQTKTGLLKRENGILSQLTQELSLRQTVPKSYVHFLLRPFLNGKDKRDAKYKNIFKDKNRTEGGYTTFTWGGERKGISGNIGIAKEENTKSLLPIQKLNQSLEQFCSPKNTKDLVIMFYGVSGTGKTYSANKCLYYLENNEITCTECILFRRPHIYSKEWFKNLDDSFGLSKDNVQTQKKMEDALKKLVKGTERITNTEKQKFSTFFKESVKPKKKILKTPLNNESSREHTLFIFTTKKGQKCYIFDLAGNEEYNLSDLHSFVITGKILTPKGLESYFRANKKDDDAGFESWKNKKKLEGIRKIYPGNLGAATFYRALYAYDVTADAKYINASLQELKKLWQKAENIAQGAFTKKEPKTKTSENNVQEIKEPTKNKTTKKQKKKKKSRKKKKTKQETEAEEIPRIGKMLEKILFQNRGEDHQIDKHIVITLPQHSPQFEAAEAYIKKSIEFGIELSTIQSKK